jgi:diacylglycerol O-acyltransferase / wax synthase
MQTMSPLDASFLHIEDAVSHMHIGSVGIFEGPVPGPGEVQDAVATRLPLVPRYRQKVRFVPLALGRPAWVDDPHFNLDYHVRRTALPAPGGDEELRNLVGRVMSQQLDRAKPLWEMWVAEGLDDGRWALISKTHHCMVDGVSATDLLSVILGTERESTPAAADGWKPEPEPNPAELVAHALARRAASPYEGVRTVLAAARSATRRSAVCRGHPRARELAPAADPPARQLAERPDRPAPAVELGKGAVGGRKANPQSPGRHHQRCRACGDHQRLPRTAALPR